MSFLYVFQDFYPLSSYMASSCYRTWFGILKPRSPWVRQVMEVIVLGNCKLDSVYGSTVPCPGHGGGSRALCCQVPSCPKELNAEFHVEVHGVTKSQTLTELNCPIFISKVLQSNQTLWDFPGAVAETPCPVQGVWV